MGSPGEGVVRLVRSAVLAVVILGVSLLAHLAGGGRAPALPVVAALGAALGPACWALTRRQVSGSSAIAVLAAGELAMHLALRAVAPLGSAGMVGMGGMTGTGHSATVMVGAHAGATLVLAALLTRGEHALWALVSVLLPLWGLARLISAPLVPIGARGMRPAGRDISLPVPVLLRVTRWRGPPAVALS